MYKKIALIVGIILVLAIGAALLPTKPVAPVGPPKLAISATFYPLAYLAEQVGGDKVTVTSVVPNGIEPHDFEPTAQDVIALRQAKAFIYNGNGLDVWAERLQPELTAAGVSVISASQAVTALPLKSEGLVVAESAEEHASSTTQAVFDPHMWLDPVRARQISELIRDTFISLDPTNAEYYRAQTANLGIRLTTLDTDFAHTLAKCQSKTIVVSHDAYSYLALRYGLQLRAIAGLAPDAEPSAKQFAELTKFITDQKVSTVFFETLASPRLAETLAQEAGVKTAVLNPIEGLTAADQQTGRNYESIMRDNLQALATALVCQ